MDAWPVMGDGSFLQRPIQIQAGVDQLVLSQGPTTLLQIAVWAMLFLAVFGGIAAFGLMFGTQTQRLVCDRATATCQLNDRPLTPLARITGAELRRTWSRANGTFYEVVLVLADGTRLDACTQSAQSDPSVAEYQATVDALRAFLAHPSEGRLDRSFVYRASLQEKLLMAIRTLVMVGIAAVLIFLWSRSSYTFDRKSCKMTATIKRFLVPAKTREIGFDRIVAIGDRRNEAGRGVDVRLADGSRIPLLFARKEAVTDSLLAQLQEILGKSVEERR